MFSFFSIRKYLPEFMQTPLFGDERWRTRTVGEEDRDWTKWCKQFTDFYESYYSNWLNRTVNAGGYSILRNRLVKGDAYLEVGPGIMPHLDFWKKRPKRLDVVDIRQEFLDRSIKTLHERGIESSGFLATDNQLPFPDGSYDAIVSFYSMEHLLDLEECLTEFKRILKPGGILVGAIPTEGGLAWGLGRWMTSRRKFRREFAEPDGNQGIRPFDFDKVIAMEHRNSAIKVIRACDRLFVRRHTSLWPLRIPLVDLNLVVRFIYANE